MKPPTPTAATARDPLYFTANAMMIGTTASTAMPAMLRRLPKINFSSERRNGRQPTGSDRRESAGQRHRVGRHPRHCFSR